MKDYLMLQYYIFKWNRTKSINKRDNLARKAIRIYQKIGKNVPNLY